MVKKIYSYTMLFFTFFIFAVLLSNIWFYKKEYKIAASVTSSYQYNMIINESVYNKLFLIKNMLNKYYSSLLKTETQNKLALTKNDLEKLAIILKTLQKSGFKDFRSFLFKYIFQIYNEDIEIIQNGNIIISKNYNNIGKKHYLPCNPFKNYGECSVFKNGKYYVIVYSPAYKLIIKSGFKANKINKDKTSKNILMILKSIPHLIIYQNGKRIKGTFDKNRFYIFEEFRPLNIFFGFGVQYSTIESLSTRINKDVIEAVKPLLYSFIIIYLGIIIFMYIVIFTVFRKKIIFVEQILDEYNKKASTDKLTEVHNRHGFENTIENQCCKYFLIVDLDNFKYINDTFGHKKGDEILKQFSSMLKNHFKNSIIGRWGGDEFLVCTDKDKDYIINAINSINTKLENIQKEFDTQMTKKLSVSAGACGNTEQDIQKRFNNADLALYKVKKTKKGNILFFKDIDYIKIEKEDISK